ncbi:MAG: hypothetical protein NXI32_24845 [bacterium]|nr:hypothetical protein [bacterium]
MGCLSLGFESGKAGADEQFILQPSLRSRLTQSTLASSLGEDELLSKQTGSAGTTAENDSATEPSSPGMSSVPSLEAPTIEAPTMEAMVRDKLEASRIPTQLASLSHRALERPQTKQTTAVIPLEPAPGWQAVGQRLREHLEQSETLLKRRAYLSARAELEQGLLYLLHVLDGMHNRHYALPAWAAAEQALKEAEDFGIERQQSGSPQLLKRLIQSHETPVLKTADTSQLAPMTAAQHYRLYAESCLLEAAHGHPWASELLQALGKTYQAQADSSEVAGSSLRLRATVFYRAAMLIDPANALAANQLGFVLLQLDRPRDAQACLISSVHAQASPAALRNLIEASYRIGDSATQQWAETALSNMRPSQAGAKEKAVQFTEVDPQTFVNLSPYQAGPKPQRAAGQQPQFPQMPH